MRSFLTQPRFAARLWLVAMSCFNLEAARGADPPYPASPKIKGIEWSPQGDILRLARESDTFPLTWADDGHLYTAFADGWGFEPLVPDKLSLGVARVEGNPPKVKGVNIRSNIEEPGDGKRGRKASGIVMVDGVLYMWLRNADQHGQEAQLVWSEDHGKSWAWAEWRFAKFGYPTFLNFGQNYTGARDDYVYVYSHDHRSAYDPADRFILMRVPQGRMRDRQAYAFFAGLDGAGGPTWTSDESRRAAVFEHTGRCLRSGITYNASLGRYLWWQQIPADSNFPDTRFEGGFGVYDAPEPWGPWTTAFFTENWDVGPGETASFPTKWMSKDGKTAYLVFSGDDNFSVRRASLTIRE